MRDAVLSFAWFAAAAVGALAAFCCAALAVEASAAGVAVGLATRVGLALGVVLFVGGVIGGVLRAARGAS